MAPRPSKAQFNSSIRKLRGASNDLNQYGRRLEAAGRELDRESRRARSRLRQLPRSQPPVYTFEEVLLNSVSEHVAADPVDRPHDIFIFLSHATADLDLARALHNALEELSADVWMDDFSTVIAGRYWVEKEFSALLNKDTVIPVLHEVSWSELEAFNPLLQLNKQLSTEDRSVEEIGVMIARTLVTEAAETSG